MSITREQIENWEGGVNFLREQVMKVQREYDGFAREAGIIFKEHEAREKRLEEALRMLYEETADYIRINHLGDVHHNRSMQLARAALE